jgi:hypothetical protein
MANAVKRVAIIFLSLAGLLCAPAIYARGTPSSHRSSPSKKSTVRGSRDGRYTGGKGSSHKGGKYQNPTTGNHDRNRKAGVPR